MPEFVQQIMTGAPTTTHFVKLAQGIIYRGGAVDVVWPQSLALAVIVAVLFSVALRRFRKTIGQMARTLAGTPRRPRPHLEQV